jgi:hypothetical protein
VSQTFVGTVTVKNVGNSTINGLLQIVFTSLPAGVSLTNATNMFSGMPYITVPAITSLSAGASATVTVRFRNPNKETINFTPVIYSGKLN